MQPAFPAVRESLTVAEALRRATEGSNAAIGINLIQRIEGARKSRADQSEWMARHSPLHILPGVLKLLAMDAAGRRFGHQQHRQFLLFPLLVAEQQHAGL